MSESVSIQRGVRVLRRFLQEQTFDVRQADVPAFTRWLTEQLSSWQDEPVFAAWSQIRDLRRGCPELQQLEKQYQQAVEADADAPTFAQLEQIKRELANSERAIAGLEQALAQAAPKKKTALQKKLADFVEKKNSLQQQQEQLQQASPQRRAALELAAQLNQLRADIGLDKEEERLQRLLRAQGQRSGKRGSSFEDVALHAAQTFLLPDYLPRGRDAADISSLRILTGVTLGAARTEFDQLIVRLSKKSAVQVLAVVEVKRNINDIAHSFQQRQEDLSWFTGDRSSYDPLAHRNKHFPTGHFDRPAIHRQGEEKFTLDSGSFRLFRRDPTTNYFLDRLCFLTRKGSLCGLSGANLSRLRHRVATDLRWQLEKESSVIALWRWVQSLAGPLETPEVLRLYASKASWARNIMFVV